MKTLLIVGKKFLALWMVFHAILSGGLQALANTSIAQERLLNFRSISSRGERTTIGRPLGLA
jgi:hypothetical protein